MLKQNNIKMQNLIEGRIRGKQKLTVTLDYGVHDARKETICDAYLDKWVKESLINVTNTEATDIELNQFCQAYPEKVPEGFKNKIGRFISLMPEDPAIFGRARFGRAMFGGSGTVRDGKDVLQITEEFFKLVSKGVNKKANMNAYYDAMHIACHYVFNRDIFLTENIKHFNKIVGFYDNIIIVKPNDFVQTAKQYYGS